MGRLRNPRHGSTGARRRATTSDLDRLSHRERDRSERPASRSLRPPEPPPSRPKADEGKVAFLLRISEYERDLLRYVAEREDRSMNRTARRYLVEALEAAARRLAEESSTRSS